MSICPCHCVMTIRHTNIQLYIQTKYECNWIIYIQQLSNNNMKSIIKSVARIGNVVYVVTKSNQVRHYTHSSNQLAINHYNELQM